MKNFKQLFAAVVTLGVLSFSGHVVAAEVEAPEALVKRISQEVLDIAKADKAIQNGSQQRVLQVVEEKILPSVDFKKMTALAAGRFWRNATPEQQQALTTQFRSLLVYTYSGAISQVRDQKVEFLPMRSMPADVDVEVRSRVLQSRGEPLQLNYRLEKTEAGWRIYDVNVLGAWLVETYKSTFAAEISRGGVDGLIKALTDKNKSLAAKSSS
ncbi:ABC transporter substrate-binding protein [Actimicrobium sp. CCI2.3]|uniref:MlaC/ttg2D family ABC transporter substrate-binding protein n=1 Tax=Actimicrobium sp. CCI2.3 TaxID=3048616 RepID=UPI002AB59163|nr:ABC transporter substrate-binding protein [Actimicrobium sp. CCI2.3]MDY7573364.1 ABC transporter substrate-binding protein [Actimicrobium sp. CCI2.3]MEB0021762.1 ABC transporter substrate-binding protein [Actimicrobium sp. CCI2.3]